ncbi:MAG: hypothetical protein K0S44_3169 [Bacteroidetes bacterium]|jgi:hypothetical protein|nr:hypothetical protein [Bacteroidota bacterium]
MTFYFSLQASFFVTFAFHGLFKDHTAYNMEIAVPAQFHTRIDRALSPILNFSFQERVVSNSISFEKILGSMDHADTGIIPENHTENS